MSDQPAKLRLDVLPSSNKTEELRAQFAASPPPADIKQPPTPAEQSATAEPLSAGQQAIKEKVIDALRTVYDPELPVNIFDLGLIYSVDVDPALAVHVNMTLTAPGCPVAGTLPGEIQRKIAAIAGVSAAKVELVWNPPWDKSRMSEVALLELGLL